MLKIILTIALLFTAIGLLCAVALALPRGAGIGRRCPPAADPFRSPFGEVPTIMPGYTREQLEAIARRPVAWHHDRNSARTAIRADQGSGGHGTASQGAAAARTSYVGEARHAR